MIDLDSEDAPPVKQSRVFIRDLMAFTRTAPNTLFLKIFLLIGYLFLV